MRKQLQEAKIKVDLSSNLPTLEAHRPGVILIINAKKLYILDAIEGPQNLQDFKKGDLNTVLKNIQ